MDNIKKHLENTPYKNYTITVASVDASFRKYYRLRYADESILFMDSSLEKDSLEPFLRMSSRLSNIGVNVPNILEQNVEDGYLIIEDFGDTHYLNVLDAHNFKTLYSQAIDEIIRMQNTDPINLPLYDKAFLTFEMDLMQEWYIEKNLHYSLSIEQKSILDKSLDIISDVVLSQPQGLFVHRDYHSRNIMLDPHNKIGTIDYQDAMNGALTYDLVSLLKDCYIEFDRKDILALALEFRDKKGLKVSDKEFIKWFDFMGMQRHIKVLGIFSRLSLRDEKDAYLKDIPLTLKYTLQAANLYDETKPLAQLLQEITKK